MDSVEIRGLSCRCIIGIRARERRVSQRVRIDLQLSLDLERAGKTGRIAHTVDYSRASSELIALLQFRRYSLLEVAAEECAGWLFAAYPAVRAVAISIFKPQALAGQAESGGVRITRQRPLEATRLPTDYGFLQSQLETSEASISVVGLEVGRKLSVSALGAEGALILPLCAGLEGPRPLHPHEAALLGAGEACENRDAIGALLVVCAQKATSDRA
jgi:7,8-dihydroneopterin aldolase/epimerase/oxygenase